MDNDLRRWMTLCEDAASDRAVRNYARRVLRDLKARDHESLTYGAITFTTTTGPVPLPIGYMATIAPNLIVGLVCGTSFPFLIDLRTMSSSTLPSEYHYAILFPYGRKSDMGGGLPATLKTAQRIAPQCLPSTGIYLTRANVDLSFIHEFQHYVDHERAAEHGRSPGATYTASSSVDDYVNTSLERNAYYIEAMDTVDKEPKSWFGRPFRKVLADFLQRLDQEFLEHLTDRNRRRLITRFYGVWREKQSSA